MNSTRFSVFAGRERHLPWGSFYNYRVPPFSKSLDDVWREREAAQTNRNLRRAAQWRETMACLDRVGC